MDNTFRERFRNASPQELVDALNGQVGNTGWVGARGFFLEALREAFLATGLDCSAFIKDGGMSLIHVRLDGDKVVPIADAPKPLLESTESLPAEGDVNLEDSQSLIDALIRSIACGNNARTEEFGQRFVSQCGDDLMVKGDEKGKAGILRPFDELHDLELVFTLLNPSPERVEELEGGDDLTQDELTLFAHAVEEECFQADGSNDAWAVAEIESTAGIKAFVAETIAGCSWEGIEYTFVGVFPSEEDATAALEELGYLDGDDFRRRYPSLRT